MPLTVNFLSGRHANRTRSRLLALEGQALRAVIVLILVLGAGIFSRPYLGEGYDSLIFVCGITIIGAMEGLVIALFSAVLAAFIFNLFISAPLYEVSFTKGTDFAPPAVFAVCAIISGMLSGRLHDQSRQVQQSNVQLESLLDASRLLQQASSEAEVFAALETSIIKRLGLAIGLYQFDGAEPRPLGHSPFREEWIGCARALAEGASEHAYHGAFFGWLLRGNGSVVGALVAKIDQAELDDSFMPALAQVVALALARTQLATHLADARAQARTEELKSALLASVSHDLRSPLTAISSCSATLLAYGDSFDRDTLRVLLGSIVEETERLNNLTTNLLEMGRLEGGASALNRTLLPVAEMIRNAVNRHKRLAGERKLIFSASREEVLIDADAVLFDLVLTNVLQNAIRYTAPDGVIIITSATNGAECTITVTDNGVGIPMEAQPKIFERFFRVKRPGEVPRGSGLGLAIARSFVEASHGSITVSSPVHDGRGTTFAIRLPLAQVCPESAKLASMVIGERE